MQKEAEKESNEVHGINFSVLSQQNKGDKVGNSFFGSHTVVVVIVKITIMTDLIFMYLNAVILGYVIYLWKLVSKPMGFKQISLGIIP